MKMCDSQRFAEDEAAFATRVFEAMRALSTSDRPGVSRPAYSAIETGALARLAQIARGCGLHTTYDRAANLSITRPYDREAPAHIVLGSHIDTVPEGGNFDGLAGIVAGLMLLRRAERRGTAAPPLRLLALRGEESAWFGTCYIGSKLLTGRLGRQELALPHVGDGRPLSAHLAALGLPIEQIEQARPLDDLARYRAYLELHIEQGPVLVESGRPAAVVGGIRGNIRFPRIRCLGEAGHSGAVPNHLRHDPTVAVSHLIVALQEAVRQENAAGHDMVATTGVLHTEPDANAVARIAGEVTFSLDIRSDDAAVLARRHDWLEGELAAIADRLGVRFDTGTMVSVAPAACDPGLVRQLLAGQRRCGLGEAPPLPSGGGHDAATFAAAGVPSAMVFVRNRHGSHNPQESMEIADLIRGVDLLDATLLT